MECAQDSEDGPSSSSGSEPNTSAPSTGRQGPSSGRASSRRGSILEPSEEAEVVADMDIEDPGDEEEDDGEDLLNEDVMQR